MSEAVTTPTASTPAPAAEAPAAAAVTPPAAAENLLADTPAAIETPAPETTTETKPEETPGLRTPEQVLEGLKLPETIAKDDPVVTAFLDGASKAGLTNEAAQALVDQIAPEITKELSKPYEAWKALQETWQSEVKADPDIGGDKLPNVVQTINKALAMFGEAEHAAVKEALKLTGGGNNPAIIKAFYRMAARLTEGSAPVTGKPAPEPKSPAKLLYGNSTA